MAQENSFRENLKKEAALQKEQRNTKLQSNGTLADFFLEEFLPMDPFIPWQADMEAWTPSRTWPSLEQKGICFALAFRIMALPRRAPVRSLISEA